MADTGQMSVELTEALLSKAAGWEVMKLARAYLAQGQVLSSYWAPPLLRGVVQAGEVSFRASMVIKSDIDIENLCTCREAREWGKICAHGVGVGLHWLREQQAPPTRSPRRHPPGAVRRSRQKEPPRCTVMRPGNSLNCSSSCPPTSTRRSLEAKSCWCSKPNGRRSMPA